MKRIAVFTSLIVAACGTKHSSQERRENAGGDRAGGDRAGGDRARSDRGEQRDPIEPADRRPTSGLDAGTATFIRVPAAKLDEALWKREAPGDRVADITIVGSYICKLETLFGPPDPHVPLLNGPPTLGFPLQHVATGELLAAVPENYGTVGLKLEDTPAFTTAANELDALLATTTPRDCERTFAGAYRVTRAGVKDGKPFFENVDFAPTLDFRIAQFEHNDKQEDWRRKHNIENDLCESLRQNWKERRDEKGRIDSAKAAYARHAEVERRLRQCLETNLADLEPQVADEWFDYDAIPGEIDHEIEAFKDLAIDDPTMATRLQRLRATAKQKAAKLRRGR